MLKIPVKKGVSIERALKQLKRKFIKTQIAKELNERKHYTKKSTKRRAQKLKAKYLEKKRLEEEL